MEFTCPRCEDSFNRKDYLIAHLKRKNECNTSASNETRQSIIDKLMTKEHTVATYECEFCTKTFILSYKNRHSKICKQNPVNIQEETETQQDNEEEHDQHEVPHHYNEKSTKRMVEINSTQIVVDKLEYEFMKQKLHIYCPSTSDLFDIGHSRVAHE